MGAGVFLWLDQRHTLKTFRASVGEEEGHFFYSIPGLFLDFPQIYGMSDKCKSMATFLPTSDGFCTW